MVSAQYSVISFPSLGISVNPPRSISLGPLNIYFYGIIIACGLVLAVLYCMNRSKEFGIQEDDILDGMADWLMDHPAVVMATPQLHFPDGRIQHLPRRKPRITAMAVRQFPALVEKVGFFRRINERYTMQDEDLTKPQPIEFCTGSFMAVRTDVFRKVGGFDRDYFMYVEDADLTQRVLCYGKVYLLPQFTAIHAWHRDPVRDKRKFWMQVRSMVLFFKKWGFGSSPVPNNP